jgi:hypothetical protein
MDYTTQEATRKPEPVVGHCRACVRDLKQSELIRNPLMTSPILKLGVWDCPCGSLKYEDYIICDHCGSRVLERDFDENDHCPKCPEKLEVAA